MFEFVTLKNKGIGVIEGQVFFEGMDCVSMVLNCALEVGFLGVLGGIVVSVMLVGWFAIFFRVGGSTFPKTTCAAC